MFAGRQAVANGPSPAASAAQASARKAGGAAKPASHAFTVRSDTPSTWAACCCVKDMAARQARRSAGAHGLAGAGVGTLAGKAGAVGAESDSFRSA